MLAFEFYGAPSHPCATPSPSPPAGLVTQGIFWVLRLPFPFVPGLCICAQGGMFFSCGPTYNWTTLLHLRCSPPASDTGPAAAGGLMLIPCLNFSTSSHPTFGAVRWGRRGFCPFPSLTPFFPQGEQQLLSSRLGDVIGPSEQALAPFLLRLRCRKKAWRPVDPPLLVLHPPGVEGDLPIFLYLFWQILALQT